MLFPGKVASLLLILSLAGCASGPGARRNPVGNWQSEDTAPPSIVAPPGFSKATNAEPARTNAGSVATPARPVEEPAELPGTWIALNRWCASNGVAAPKLVAPPPAPVFALTSSNGTFLVRAGSESGEWNHLEVRLGFQPQMINNQPYVHALDLKKTLKPLLQGASRFQLDSNSVVVIDPGHGGENAGTRSVHGNAYEKEYTLDWARRLEAVLRTNGMPWQVVLTRTNDVDIALSNRVAFAETHNAAVFLSLHFNSAAPNSAESGLETYCLTPAGLPSNLTRGSDDLSLVFPNNAFDGQNLQLAVQMHRALLAVNNRDRGVRRARFPGVLRGQRCPSILVEGGYLSNPAEAALVANPAYRQKLAEAVARGLAGLRRAEESPAHP